MTVTPTAIDTSIDVSSIKKKHFFSRLGMG